jgi:VanZ family protein
MIKLGIICHYMQRVFQVVAWLLILAIVMLSLGPPSTRPVTGAGHNFEHLLIFVATGAAFGLGYPRRFSLLPIALLTFTAVIEIAQMLVPGRHARLSDFLTDAAASCVGIGFSFVVVKLTAAMSKG